MMKKTLSAAILAFACAAISADAQQSKGVDRQSERVRDAGSNRVPTKNGSVQDVGTGRGIDFGRGRTPAATLLPNPLRLTAARAELMRAVEDLVRERKLTLDTAASKPETGIFVTQPYTFSKGALVTDSELTRYAERTGGDDADRNFNRARYTLIVEVQSIDSVSANVSVNARVEARGESLAGPEWVSLPSSGIVEQEFLTDLAAKLNDSPATIDTDQP